MQQFTVHVVEMNYLRGIFGVTRLKDESNSNVYERCSTRNCTNEVIDIQSKCASRKVWHCFKR